MTYTKKFVHYLPRILIIVFIISLVLPAPDFIAKMDDNSFLIWILRLIWVITLPVIFYLIILLIILLGKVAHKLKKQT